MTNLALNDRESCFSFKSRSQPAFEDYDTPWESDFRRTGLSLLHTVLKEIIRHMYLGEYSEDIKENSMHSDTVKKMQWDFSYVKMKSSGIENENGKISFDDAKSVKVLRCESNMDDVIGYCIEKYGNMPYVKPDEEDFLMLKSLLPVGYMSKHQFSGVDEFYNQCKRCWDAVVYADSFMYHIENIKLDDDEAKVLYLQAPTIMENKFGYSMNKNKVWSYFRKIDSYTEYMKNKLRNALQNDSMVLMLLESNEDHRIEVCRVINTANGTQVNCAYNTCWLFDRLNVYT